MNAGQKCPALLQFVVPGRIIMIMCIYRVKYSKEWVELNLKKIPRHKHYLEQQVNEDCGNTENDCNEDKI